MNYLMIFAGGGIGACIRYFLSGFVHRFLPAAFPFGTITVNITGCFIIGVLMSIFEKDILSGQFLRLFLITGILGGFTTFSSFSYETVDMIRSNALSHAALNVIFSIVSCLVSTGSGIYAARLFHRGGIF